MISAATVEIHQNWPEAGPASRRIIKRRGCALQLELLWGAYGGRRAPRAGLAGLESPYEENREQAQERVLHGKTWGL